MLYGHHLQAMSANSWNTVATLSTCHGTRPEADIGLSVHGSTVDFYPVRPSGSGKVLRLPRDVTVVTSYRGTRVRNTHQYFDFKLFRVESTIKPAE
jgi:hypothetical protein